MSIKSKAELLDELYEAITDPLNRQNSAPKVRNIIRDIIDSSVNTIDGFTGATANSFTTGATMVGTTAYFNRNDIASAYTLDLSSFSGGSSASLWSSSTGSDSIIANNSTGNVNETVYGITIGANNIVSSMAGLQNSSILGGTNNYIQ